MNSPCGSRPPLLQSDNVVRAHHEFQMLTKQDRVAAGVWYMAEPQEEMAEQGKDAPATAEPQEEMAEPSRPYDQSSLEKKVDLLSQNLVEVG